MSKVLRIHWEYDSGDYWIELRGQELSDEVVEYDDMFLDEPVRLKDPIVRADRRHDRT
ncbi:MAG: hypothetical protein JO291_09260 [Acidimicrobiia bacterium]|nr:hypothetical protein [Acidimicrobiia bacterium]